VGLPAFGTGGTGINALPVLVDHAVLDRRLVLAVGAAADVAGLTVVDAAELARRARLLAGLALADDKLAVANNLAVLDRTAVAVGAGHVRNLQTPRLHATLKDLKVNVIGHGPLSLKEPA
jgi:hypothetical protein